MTLAIDAPGPVTDRLAATGDVALGGTLDLNLTYTPAPWTAVGGQGDWLHILSAGGSLAGAFEDHNLPDVETLGLPSPTHGYGWDWRIVYDYDDVTPDEALLSLNPSFSSQPWLGNGTKDVVLVIHELVYEPVAHDDEYMTYGGYPVEDDVSVNDEFADAYQLVADSGPLHGTLDFNVDGTFTYTPDVGFEGDDTFQYIALDTVTGHESAPGLVTIHSVLYHPEAFDDEYENYGGYPVGGNVLDNDMWSNGAELVEGSEPAGGSLMFNSDGSFDYAPEPGFEGDVTFQYIALDTVTGLQSEPAVVTIHVIQYDPLKLDRAPIESGGAVLTMTELAPIGSAAIERWRAAGVADDVLAARLAGLQFVIADLPGSDLAGAAAGSVIAIDSNAAGYGWFLDASPWDDAEFVRVMTDSERRATGGSPASERVDLLTAVMHEMGHLLGLDHGRDETNIMAPELDLATRRLPTAGDAAIADYLFTIWQQERRAT